MALLAFQVNTPGSVHALEPNKAALGQAIKEAERALEPDVNYLKLLEIRSQLLELKIDESQLTRSEKIALYAQFLSELEKYIKKHPPTTDFTVNTPLPAGAPGLDGLSPEAIKDPEQRIEYIKRDSENRERARNSANLTLVKKMQSELRQDVAIFCAQAYRQSVEEQEALRQDLSGWVNTDPHANKK